MQAEMERLWEDGRAEAIVARLRELGFLHVTVDLQGFRSGSLHEALLRLRAKAASS
jgi:PP-loop superfamily ATP-utilizing enzyme